MAESDDQKKKPEEGNLDLSDLSSMSLGPDWVSGKKPRTQLPDTSRDDRPRGPKGPRKDRRGSLPPKRRPERGGTDRGERTDRRGHDRGGRHERHERPAQPFKPIVEATFYPEEEPFRVLSQAIRTSCRTFELFEIARLILEKPDRFVCVVRDPEQKEGDPARLYASVPDGLPFRSEEEALTHTLQHYMDDFFDKESVEVDPPAGSFQLVHKCGFTGEILGPPNYHRYQAMCREHHAAKLAHMPYSRFEQRLETSREEDDIQAWMQKMRTQTHFKAKENPELVFKSFEDARLHLITQSKDKLVRPAYSARFSGKAIALLNPGDPIRRSVDSLLDYQKKFPLDTANHLRGRLRRMNFAVYKRGSKGVSYVCAVKRRFRKPNEVLADNLQELVDFLEAHPNFPAKDLPKGFLGINPAKKQETASAKAAAADVAKEVEKEISASDVAEEKPEAGTEPEIANAEARETVAAEPKAETPKPASVLSDSEQAAVRQLKTDLHYLVSEGYVIEYSDGRLFVPPIREEEIRRVEKQKEESKAVEEPAETEPAKPAPEAEAKDPEPPPKAPEAEASETPADPVPVAESEPEPAAESVPEPASEPVPEPASEPEPESSKEPEPAGASEEASEVKSPEPVPPAEAPPVKEEGKKPDQPGV